MQDGTGALLVLSCPAPPDELRKKREKNIRPSERTQGRALYQYFCIRQNALNSRKQIAASPLRKRAPQPYAQSCAQCLPVQGRAGVANPFACARCGLVDYCSKDHQRAHWKANHKSFCIAKADRAPLPEVPCALSVWGFKFPPQVDICTTLLARSEASAPHVPHEAATGARAAA